MIKSDLLRGDPLPWLLEEDNDNPGVRYFALRDLLGLPEDDPQVRRARQQVMTGGPVPKILAAQDAEGWWVRSGSGYSPKYQATVWQIILLAELGADPADERVRRGCEYLLANQVGANGAFSANRPATASGAIHCLSGNLINALFALGLAADARLQAALNWHIQAINGEGDIRYYVYTPGPGYVCGVNQNQPCGWGAVKALKGLNAVPPEMRTPAWQRAVQAGVDLLLSRDPAKADYPYSERVSSTWFKLGFPLSYWSDVLEIIAVLVDAGCGSDPRLENALKFILDKQDAQGRWKMENSLNGKMWADIEKKGKPSKWVTLRALRVLRGLA